MRSPRTIRPTIPTPGGSDPALIGAWVAWSGALPEWMGTRQRCSTSGRHLLCAEYTRSSASPYVPVIRRPRAGERRTPRVRFGFWLEIEREYSCDFSFIFRFRFSHDQIDLLQPLLSWQLYDILRVVEPPLSDGERGARRVDKRARRDLVATHSARALGVGDHPVAQLQRA